jgi:pimeloyl-ACP methyl ester carboxylesterase
VIAAFVARTRPDLVRGLFLEDPPLFRGEQPQRESRVASMFPVLRQVLREMRARKAGLAEYEAMVRSAPALNGAGSMADVLGEAGTRALAGGWAGADPEIFTPAIDGAALAGAHPEVPLTRPVHVVRADPALGAAFLPEDEKRFLATNPHATVNVFERTSHAVHDEQPARFVADLESFLARLCGT